jgi:hypothetical protein
VRSQPATLVVRHLRRFPVEYCFRRRRQGLSFGDAVAGSGGEPVDVGLGEQREFLTYIFVTWSKDSSTGVSRPDMDTSTLSLRISGLISLTVAGSVANRPSMTMTGSPISN